MEKLFAVTLRTYSESRRATRPGAIGVPGRAESRSWTGRSSSATTGSRASAGLARISSTSSIRFTYSSSTFGTHHIFFPPRLQLVAIQHPADRLSAHRGDDLSASRLLGDQRQRPLRPTRRWRRADHRHDRRLLPRVQESRRRGPRILAKRLGEPTLQEAPTDPANLPRIRAGGRRRVGPGPAPIAQLPNAHAPPDPRLHPLLGQGLQFHPALGRKLEPGELAGLLLS